MFFKVIGRLTARFFRNIAKFFYTSFRNVRRHPIGTLLTLIVLGGVITLLFSTSFFGFANPSGARPTVIKQVEYTPEPESKSSELLAGLKDGKAGVMYSLLSEDYRKILNQQGITSGAVMQELVDKKLQELTGKKDGRINYSFIYAQGIRFSDGSVRNGFSGTAEISGNRRSVTVILMLKDGKITQVESDEPVLVAAFETNKTTEGKDAQLGVVNNNRSPVAEDFMKGLTTFDVDKIWNSLSDTYKEQLKTKGVTRDSMAKLFNQIKTDNSSKSKNNPTITYDGYAYLNTINFPNGITVHEFISVLSVADDPRQPRYSIVMDSTNKIIRLGNDSAQDPIFTAILGRGQGQ
jgi:hypothetical protein